MAKASNKSVPQVAGELWELTKGYARQETVDPLKGVGRYLAFGFSGAVFLSIGVVLLMLALLRALQLNDDLKFGSWSWVPYVIVLSVGVLAIVVAVSRISKTSRKRG